MALTVAQLIKELQQVPNQQAVVTVNDAAGANLVAAGVVESGTGQTFAPDAPEAEFGDNGAAASPGTVVLTGSA
jgi:hypothetical protein